jgi:hypothetical protein
MILTFCLVVSAIRVSLLIASEYERHYPDKEEQDWIISHIKKKDNTTNGF